MLSNTATSALVSLALTLGAATAHAQQAQGPAPIFDGQTENISIGNQVTGAVNAIATHPTDPNIAFIGSVNGGVWKATQLGDDQQAWEPQTAFGDSQSIGDVVFDSADPTHQTVVAGAGRFSSYGRRGGALTGLMRTTTGGGSWQVFGQDLVGRNISKLTVNGDRIFAAVNSAEPFDCDKVGVFRSTNGGDSFFLMSQADEGIPRGVSTAVAANPADPTTVYASVIFADTCDGGQNGIYRNVDGGLGFVKVSDAAMDAVITNDSGIIEIAVGGDGRVVVATSQFGRLAGVFFSDDEGATWTSTDLPGTNEPTFVGVHAGGQASVHFSLAIDPTNSNNIYIGGDRQPLDDNGGFPNSLGAFDFSGRLFRGDLSAPSGSQWTPLTHSGTFDDSAPHADSRDMAFDANGDLIETDDGGVYRRTQPASIDGNWISLNGNGDLQITEAHNMAFDANAGVLLTGNQDTGTSQQNTPSGLSWFALQNGDGGDVAVDIQTLDAQEQSLRYSSFQFLFGFSRRTFDDQNNFVNFTSVPLTVISGAPFSGQFTTPVILNQANAARLILGGDAAIYESLDQGDTIAALTPGVVINGFDGRAAAYGSMGAEDLLFAGTGSTVFRRVNAGDALTPVFTSPIDGSITAIALDPSDPNQVFVTDGTGIYRSIDGGDNFVDVTGNINDVPFAPLGRIRALQFVEGPSFDALFVGADRTIRATNADAGYNSWLPYFLFEPNALVYEFDYDVVNDSLYIGTLGRGTFSVGNATNQIIFFPVATNDTVTGFLNQVLDIDVLTNDTHPGGVIDPQTVNIVEEPQHGDAVVDPLSGVITYTPDTDYTGADAITYRVSDERKRISNIASVSIDVFAVTDSDGDGVGDDVDNCTLVPNSDQRDTNGDGFGNICDADLNNDGVINAVDLGLLRLVFFSDDDDADFNGDGLVNVIDLGVLRVSFFTLPGPSGVAP